MAAPLPADEGPRLAALRAHWILDTEPELAFDDIAKLAAQICQVPVALVTLVDEDRQWFKAKVGWDVQESPRAVSFCAHAILDTQLLVVPDAAVDARFRDNPDVMAGPRIRFYAGMPISSDDGYRLGTVCVIDRVPRQLTAMQRQALTALGHQASRELTLRRKVADMEQLVADLAAAEKAARESEGMLRRVVNQAPVVIFAIDAGGIFTLAEGKSLEPLGLLPKDLVGRSVFEAYAGHPAILDAVNRCLAGEQVSVELELQGVTFAVTYSPVRNAAMDVIGLVGIATDITETRKAEALGHVAMERALDIAKLRGIVGFKTDALNTIAHELNTPMTPIRMQLHILQSAEGISEKQRGAIAIVDRNVRRMAQLIENMLEFARLESETVEVRMLPIDLAQVVREAVADYRDAAIRQGLLMECSDSGAVPVTGDVRRLGQLMANLLSNAVKYTPGPGKVQVTVEVRDGRALVSVADSGVGMREDEIPRLFQPFGRLESRLPMQPTGTGLGLHISKRIVALHGGAIWAESFGPGQGSCFRFTLPRAST